MTFAFADELVGATGVAEVREGLAGVDGEVGFGYPGAPGGSVGAGVGEVVLGRGEGAQGGVPFTSGTSCGEGASQAQLAQAAGFCGSACSAAGAGVPGGIGSGPVRKARAWVASW